MPFGLLSNYFNSLARPSLNKQRTVNLRPGSPIDPQTLLAAGDTKAFVVEVARGPELMPDEVNRLFQKAGETANAEALISLANRYPSVVNPDAFSKLLACPETDATALTYNLLENRQQVPEHLLPLFSTTPGNDTKIVGTWGQLNELLNNFPKMDALAARVFFRNGEHHDGAVAVIDAAGEKAAPANNTARAMMEYDGIFKTPCFPSHFPEQDLVEQANPVSGC